MALALSVLQILFSIAFAKTNNAGLAYANQDTSAPPPVNSSVNLPANPPAAPVATPPTVGSSAIQEPPRQVVALPELSPNGIEKVYILLADSKIESKLILNILKTLKKLQIAPKLIVSEGKASLELETHLNPEGKLLFEDFAKGSRQNFPFKDNERRIFLTSHEILLTNTGKPTLIGIDSRQGTATISTAELLKDSANLSGALQKLLLKSLAGLFHQTSTCGVLGPFTDLSSLKQLPGEFCAQDIDSLKTIKLLK